MTLNITEPTVGASSGTWGQQLNDALTAIVAYVNSVEGNAQPVDSDLTAIAALATTAYGRSLLTQANAAAAQATLGLGTAATQASSAFDAAGAAAAAQAASQPLDSDLTAIAALTTTTFGRSFLALADAAAARTLLGLGTAATQASSAFDTAGAASTAQAASLQKSANLSDLASAATARTNLGLGDVATHAASEFVTTANAAPLAQAGQTPSQAPTVPGVTAVGSLAVTARADHVHASAGLFGWLGDGSDGAATFDGTATPAGVTKVSSTLYRLGRDVFYANVTISAGVTIDTASFLLFARGTITGPTSGSHAIISSVQSGGASGTNNGTATTAVNTFSFNRGAQLGLGIKGANGATGAGSGSTAWNTIGNGAASGAGGTGSGGAGGAAIAANSVGTVAGKTPDSAWRNFHTATTSISSVIDSQNPVSSSPNLMKLSGGAGGGSGGGDGTNVGGAGGPGGHITIVNAYAVVGLVDITSPGGAGGTPTTGNCGGGGGGAGGVARLNACDLTGWTGAVSAPGGAGGSGVGTGTVGAAGSAGVAIASSWL